MAANLSITSKLKQAFEAACTSGNTRCVRARIQGETITVSSNPTLTSTESAEDDFVSLSKDKISPQYYLWNTEPSNSSEWILVCYVLDTCNVRDKMLYASCHKNVTQQLGASFFKGMVYMNEESEFIYQSVVDAMRSSTVGAPLTEAEVARSIEEKASQGQGVSQSGMSSLPFQLTESATAAMATLKENQVNFVELKVDDKERVDMCTSKSIHDSSEIASSMNQEEGRFYVLRYPVENKSGKLFFILSCPESTPIKQKMVLSVVKSTVLDACKSAGLEFFKMLEVQDVNETEGDLISEIKQSEEDRSLKNDAAFSKPKGPPGRRGKRRMMKSNQKK